LGGFKPTIFLCFHHHQSVLALVLYLKGQSISRLQFSISHFLDDKRRKADAVFIEFNEAIKKNHIILDGMLNRGAYNAYKEEIKKDPEKHADMIESLEGRMADYTVFSDEFFNYDSEIWIFKTTTLIINWNEEVAIEITNANMTGFLKDMFEFVKEGGSKLDHNKTMRELLN